MGVTGKDVDHVGDHAGVEKNVVNRIAEDPNINKSRLTLEFGVTNRTENCITTIQFLHPLIRFTIDFFHTLHGNFKMSFQYF